MFVLAILTTGKTIITEKSVRDSLFAGRMSNKSVLAKAGKLVVAGPFEKMILTTVAYSFLTQPL